MGCDKLGDKAAGTNAEVYTTKIRPNSNNFNPCMPMLAPQWFTTPKPT
jgi:hypothetical protein